MIDHGYLDKVANDSTHGAANFGRHPGPGAKVAVVSIQEWLGLP